MTLAVLDPWIALAKEWQLLLAGLLAVLAALILAVGIVKAAKIRAAKSGDNREKLDTHDLRTSVAPGSIDTDTFDSVNGNLESFAVCCGLRFRHCRPWTLMMKRPARFALALPRFNGNTFPCRSMRTSARAKRTPPS